LKPGSITPSLLTGFLVLAVCVVMTALSRGAGETFSVFLLPLSSHFGWERASVASVYSVYMVSIGLGSLLAGMTFDRFGARFNYLSGTLILAIAYSLAGRLEHLWQFYLVIGVCGGVGASMIGLVPTQSLLSRWYHKRLSTALSIGYASQGLGTLMLVPLVQVFIESAGWQQAYRYMGWIFIAIFLVVLFLPWRVISAGAADNPRKTQDGKVVGGMGLRQAVRTRAFWGFFGIFGATAVGIFGISLQSVAYLIDRGYSELEAAFAFGTVGMLSFVGMVLTGIAAEYWPKHIVASCSYTLSLFGIAALALMQVQVHPVLLFVYIAGLGLSSGARGPIITTLMAEFFAGKGLASIYGAANIGQGVGAALGAFVAGLLYDLTGNYNAGFLFCAGALVFGLLLFWVVPEIRNAAMATDPETDQTTDQLANHRSG
jgi:MFS family permease